MSEENIEDLVAENLKVRVVLKEPLSLTGEAADEQAAPDFTPRRISSDRQYRGPATIRRESSSPTVNREAYTYHYGRIFSAIGFLLGLLVLLIFIAFDATSTRVSERQLVEAEPSSIGDEVANVEEGDDSVAVKMPLAADNAVEKSSNPIEVDGSDKEQLSGSNQLGRATVATAQTEMTSRSVQQGEPPLVMEEESGANLNVDAQNQTSQVTPVVNITLPTATKEVGNTSEAASESTVKEGAYAVIAGSASTDDPAKSVVVERLSPNVVAAKMSARISGRKPVGMLATEIDLGEPPFQTVYIFSSVNNLDGEKLTYRWYLNDKLVAEVPVLVKRNNKWRSYSSKNINGQMGGQWKVELADANDQALLRAFFKVNVYQGSFKKN